MFIVCIAIQYDRTTVITLHIIIHSSGTMTIRLIISEDKQNQNRNFGGSLFIKEEGCTSSPEARIFQMFIRTKSLPCELFFSGCFFSRYDSFAINSKKENVRHHNK